MSRPVVPRFTTVRLREGYFIEDVDAFIAEVVPQLDHGMPDGALATRITEVRFAPVRLKRGYDMDEVDRFLDVLIDAAGGRPA